ncbi:Protein N-methyltransferase nnt1 [Grifola frondosa]|uniref:Protein N-methyltransferase nnt1 n=1 Tax=Grifola frondosa TaxID=5627 RepID=A0A1C7LTK0_GRIFR|nr:Protein N-methyltransferase nnt1 [Grifola frondosa]
MDDLLEGSAALFGEVLEDDDHICYGPLDLSRAPKEGKANTLLADQLFSPSLLLAEHIERGIIPLESRTVIELGAGCALPSLLASVLPKPPSLVVITDYPDDTIMGNLTKNVETNRKHVSDGCRVHCTGYEWGQDASTLLEFVKQEPFKASGFDVMILSDLLHFDRSHDELIGSLTSLLHKTSSARAYIAAGKYTHPDVCYHFLQDAEKAGFVLEEGEVERQWQGSLLVKGAALDREQLGVRKNMCRWWTARWTKNIVELS